MKTIGILSASFAALGLSACVSLLPEGGDLSPRLTLDAGAPRPAASDMLPVTLAVADPRSEAIFNTSNVAVLTSPLQYEYLAEAEWTDRAPLLLGRFLERRFENTGLFGGVGDRVAIPVSDYTLQTDIRALNLDRTGGQRRAVVAYGARLLDRRGNTLGSRVFQAEQPVDGAGNAAAVLALNTAAQRAADETIAWSEPLVRQDLRNREANPRSRGRADSLSD
ncbi:ABC-type transport auxiliary lipoprotein family protein [Parvularcula oceani]|uniref:ABC-type transport auxiliary lipoprotein family protein n=1 Tax=Parvularcula oceani TaxID=1247963 RepID=UPI0004E1B57D|nr:ABC-type transport auxiliary lipoprotein family protein [Parvularcula oceani]